MPMASPASRQPPARSLRSKRSANSTTTIGTAATSVPASDEGM